MISEAEYIFFIAFAGLFVLVCLTLLKVQSTEPITITTSEFKKFQSNFLIGYMTVMMGEVLCVASFFHTMTVLRLSFDQITLLYIVSVASTTICGILAEIVDIGSRRDKCITTALLYAIATFTLFSGGNIEILICGRCLYGAGSVLLHSAFDSYLVHDHTSQGFPDDWLLHTFSKLAHGMTSVAIAAGVIGQSVASVMGPLGVAGLSIIFFLSITFFILNTWNKDVGSGSKFMFSSFSHSVGQAVRSLRSSNQMLLVVGLSVVTEASIIIFTFYWAPLLASVFASVIETSGSSSLYPALSSTIVPATFSSAAAGSATSSSGVAVTGAVQSAARYLAGTATEPAVASLSLGLSSAAVTSSSAASTASAVAVAATATIPFVLIYATLMMSTMLGNYIYTISVSKYGNDSIFQAVLMLKSAAYFLGATVQSPQMVFIASLVIQTCSGGYWPSIGYLRGRYFVSEVRSVMITLTRVFTLCIVAPVLWVFHESFTMTLLVCSGLNALAVFFQFKITQAELRLQGETDEYEYEEES